MKKILYATDFSENSVMALKYAEELTVSLGAELVVLHVFDLPTILSSPTEAPTFPKIEEDEEDYVKRRLVEFCNDHLVNIDITADAISDNSVVNGIVSKSEQHSAELIVVGVNGNSQLREIIMGRTAKGLIKDSICPVLTVPFDAPLKLFKEVIYATDFEEEDIEAIKQLTKIVKPYDGKIHVTHVAVKDEFSEHEKLEWFRDMLEDEFEFPNIEYSVQLAGDVVKRIEFMIKKKKPSLLVMLEREHPGINKWIQKDLVMSVIVKSSVPILIYNERNISLRASTRKGNQKTSNYES